mmetsp:Transcript_26882/g.86341  ORF Transcript_26882/g.86341 Transcript_26882/m.86341 type:complete len:301 (+) Transcript_26882:1169-2071(+)
MRLRHHVDLGEQPVLDDVVRLLQRHLLVLRRVEQLRLVDLRHGRADRGGGVDEQGVVLELRLGREGRAVGRRGVERAQVEGVGVGGCEQAAEQLAAGSLAKDVVAERVHRPAGEDGRVAQQVVHVADHVRLLLRVERLLRRDRRHGAVVRGDVKGGRLTGDHLCGLRELRLHGRLHRRWRLGRRPLWPGLDVRLRELRPVGAHVDARGRSPRSAQKEEARAPKQGQEGWPERPERGHDNRREKGGPQRDDAGARDTTAHQGRVGVVAGVIAGLVKVREVVPGSLELLLACAELTRRTRGP